MIRLRPATPADVAEMSRILIASITELCTADHHGDASLIDAWTRNKSPESVAGWLSHPNALFLVAELDGRTSAVGSLHGADEIALNYIDPAARFQGLSKAMLEALEQQMRDRGAAVGRLSSTATARPFYRAAGWRDAGPAETMFGLSSYPMSKDL